MSSHRFAWRLPGAFVCASSSTRISSGLRARAASRSNSRSFVPRYSTKRGGRTFESLEERLGLGAPVGFDDPDDDVLPFGLARLGRHEHGVGLADAGGHAEEDLQLAASLPLLLGLDLLEQFVGIGASFLHGRNLT